MKLIESDQIVHTSTQHFIGVIQRYILKFCKSMLLFLNETQKMQRYYVDAVNTTKDHTSWAANCDLRAMYKLDFINPILLRKSRLAFRYDCAPSNICGMFFYFII